MGDPTVDIIDFSINLRTCLSTLVYYKLLIKGNGIYYIISFSKGCGLVIIMTCSGPAAPKRGGIMTKLHPKWEGDILWMLYAMWFCSCRITKYGHAQLYCDNSQEMAWIQSHNCTQPMHRHYDGEWRLLSNHRNHHLFALRRHYLLEVFILQINIAFSSWDIAFCTSDTALWFWQEGCSWFTENEYP